MSVLQSVQGRERGLSVTDRVEQPSTRTHALMAHVEAVINDEGMVCVGGYCACGAFWIEYDGGLVGCPVARLEREYATAIAGLEAERDARITRELASADCERSSFERDVRRSVA
jgi:hypothetical protein